MDVPLEDKQKFGLTDLSSFMSSSPRWKRQHTPNSPFNVGSYIDWALLFEGLRPIVASSRAHANMTTQRRSRWRASSFVSLGRGIITLNLTFISLRRNISS
jgi:hypothetical protein